MERRNSKSPAARSPGVPKQTPQPVENDLDLTHVDLSEIDLSAVDLGALDLDDELQLQPLEEPAQPTVKPQSTITSVRPTSVVPSHRASPGTSGTTEPAMASGKKGVKPGPTATAKLVSAEAMKVPPREEAVEPEIKLRRRWWYGATPSWLVSLVVHVAILFTLAAITLDPIDKVLSILRAATSQTQDSIQQFEVQGPQLDKQDLQDDPLMVPTTEVSQVVAMPELTSMTLPTTTSAVDVLESNRLTESIMPSALLHGGALSQMTTSLNSRSSASKSEMLERFGGNSESEKAVASLKWIAEHQTLGGGWTFAHSEVCRGQCDGQGDLAYATNAATAMAILPFLGAGQTHMEGQYKETVHKGLSFLINRMKVTSGALPEGSWHEPGGTMYSHGLASIAICEAYAMTRDPDLLQPAQLSLNYLIASQDPHGGGWRYEPKQPGDTSVAGWCVMALKSGRMGNLVIPEQTFAGAKGFLDSMSTNQGAYYGYDQPVASLDGRQAVTAVGLLCRMYMGWPKEHPGIQAGVKYLAKTGPNKDDLYYSYYGTQVLRHYGGPDWEKWNSQLRDQLIRSQVSQGHAAGSWLPNGGHGEQGGRLYTTSLATMILEVYYRHMPLYSEKSADDDFEL